jgi:hypothetical protein
MCPSFCNLLFANHQVSQSFPLENCFVHIILVHKLQKVADYQSQEDLCEMKAYWNEG